MKHSKLIGANGSRLLALAFLLAGITIAGAQTSSSAADEKNKVPKAKADPITKEVRRALREAEREVAQAQREARFAPKLADDHWEALQEVPWPVIDESMELAREAMDMAQVELQNLDLTEINESLEELAFMMPPHGIPPYGVPPYGTPPLPPMPAIPPIPPIPAIAPMALQPPHFDHCPRGGIMRDAFQSSKEYQPYLSEDERLRLTALSALINQDETAAFDEIKNVIAKNQNWAMRAVAVELLACIEDVDSVNLLRETLRHETDQRVRLAAVRALAHHDEPEAREALQELLK